MPAVMLAERLVVPQATEDSEPQPPEKSWTLAPDAFRSVPTDYRGTPTVAAYALVIEYQTSSSGFPVAHATGILLLAVAAQTVPEAADPLERAVAAEHSSLAGGGEYTTQMLKTHLCVGVEVGVAVVKTLT